jgi:hypothetical protein
MGEQIVAFTGWIPEFAPKEGRTVVEIGRRVDCAANGCEVPHSDDGMIMHYHPKATNHGHALTFVSRRVTYSDWTETALRPPPSAEEGGR